MPQKDLRNQRLSESATVRSHWGHRVYSLGIPFGKDVRGPRSPSGHPAVHSRYAEWREAKRTKSHVFRRAAQTSDHGPARRRTRTAKHRTASENVLMGRMSEPADISQPLWPRNGQRRRASTATSWSVNSVRVGEPGRSSGRRRKAPEGWHPGGGTTKRHAEAGRVTRPPSMASRGRSSKRPASTAA